MAKAGTASLTIAELREFASFTEDEQLFIERSLDVGLGRGDAFKQWSGARRQRRDPQPVPRLPRAQGAARGDPGRDLARRGAGLHRRADPDHRAGPRAGADHSFSRLPLPLRAPARRAVRARGCRPRSAAPPRCRRSARAGARPCSSRSAKPPPPRPAGPSASRASIRRRSRPRRPERLSGFRADATPACRTAVAMRIGADPARP